MRENGTKEETTEYEHHEMVTKCEFIEYMLVDFYERVKNKTRIIKTNSVEECTET